MYSFQQYLEKHKHFEKKNMLCYFLELPLKNKTLSYFIANFYLFLDSYFNKEVC